MNSNKDTYYRKIHIVHIFRLTDNNNNNKNRKFSKISISNKYQFTILFMNNKIIRIIIIIEKQNKTKHNTQKTCPIQRQSIIHNNDYQALFNLHTQKMNKLKADRSNFQLSTYQKYVY